MKQLERQQFRILLSPSWLSGLIVGVVWLVLVVGGLAATHFAGSQWQQGLFNLGTGSSATYQQLTDHVKDNRVISNVPLVVFWLGVGLIVYYLAIAVYDALHEVVELHEELDYVNVRRRQLLRSALEQLAVRLMALIVWFLYIALFFKQLVPYALSAFRALGASYSLHRLELAVLAAIVLLLGLHLHTVLLRLVVLKERLFSSTYQA